MKFIHILFISFLLTACVSVQNEQPIAGEVSEDSQGRTKYREIYDNGQVKMDGWMMNDKRVGLWIAYYENGVRWSENEFRDGFKEGKSVTYYPNGIMRYRGHYIEDIKAGTWQFYDENGKVVKEEDFNK